MGNLNYHVAPRYTAGSPASVNEAIARKVAAEEKEDYERTLEGVYGIPAAQRAHDLGLAGIVEERIEFSKGWHVTDLITGRQFDRLTNVKPKKAQYGDVLVDVNTSGYSFLPLYGEKRGAFPFKVRRVEKVDAQYILVDPEERRLIVPKDAEFKLEREAR